MPSLTQIREEITRFGTNYDHFRKKYISDLSKITGRNTIIYYSGWLNSTVQSVTFGINDDDINGFMAVIHQLDQKKGLDLILHTPGGEVGATESIVNYLRQIFNNDIRVIVPQIAMSGGTMIACSAKEILMGKQSSLGPIDPQYRGLSAQGVLDEFKKAHDDIVRDKTNVPLWQAIISRYTPTLIGECQNAITWSEGITRQWLLDGMFKAQGDSAKPIVDKIMSHLASHSNTKSHERHISASKATEIGLNVKMIESEQALQDAILTIHHATMLTFSITPISKIIENQDGKSYVHVIEMPR